MEFLLRVLVFDYFVAHLSVLQLDGLVDVLDHLGEFGVECVSEGVQFFAVLK